MKMFWFFSATSEIPWAFKLCGIFQMCCDFFLGVQYWIYGEGDNFAAAPVIRETHVKANGLAGNRAGFLTPVGEKDDRLD